MLCVHQNDIAGLEVCCTREVSPGGVSGEVDIKVC